jgi:hypothetical protein
MNAKSPDDFVEFAKSNPILAENNHGHFLTNIGEDGWIEILVRFLITSWKRYTIG